MKKYFEFNKKDIPLYVSLLVLIVFTLLWLFPGVFGKAKDPIAISQYRNDLKDFISIFYIVLTLWLVLLTRKMAEISINSQKAFNRPEINCELFISSEKPSVNHFLDIKNIEIRNAQDSTYIEGLAGASIFLILKNRYGGGKCINLSATISLEATNPEKIILSRPLQLDYLAEGFCIAYYLYRFEKPNIDKCSIKLVNCKVQFSTPFDEASKEIPLEINFGIKNEIIATGDLNGAIKLLGGIVLKN